MPDGHATGARPRVAVCVFAAEEAAFIQAVLAAEGADALVCPVLLDLCGVVVDDADAAILSEEVLADRAVRLLAETRERQPKWSDPPILLMTNSGAASETAVEALRELGNVLPLDRPVRRETLVNALRIALRARSRQLQVRDLMEDALRREQALRESEERFRVMAETVPEILFTNLPDGRWDYANMRCYEYTGLSPAAVEGFGWHQAVHPEDLRRVDAMWRVSARAGKTFEAEYRLRAADGTYRWFRARARPIRDEHGNIVKWFGACTDIDDLRRAHEELKRTAAELKRSNEDLEQFAYVVSHDLQSPLAQIVGFTQLLRNRCQGALDEKALEFTDFAVSGARRMSQLINGLLAYSRAGTQDRLVMPTDAQEVLRNVLASLNHCIEETGAVVVHDPLPTVRADATQLSQLFQNLVENAVKFRREGSPRIHISARKADGMWEFSFRDNGIGIDQRQQRRAFLVFQRLHDPDKYPGTGIGLAICKKIVERHGGKIWIESQPEEGTTFHFTLPDEA